MGKFVVDTSALIDNPFLCEKIDGEIIVPYVTIQELDKLKSENYNAREAIRQLEKCDRVLVDRDFEIENNDDMILDTAITNNATLITNDCGLKLKAKTVGVPYESVEDEKDDYKGYKEVLLSESEMAFLYENLDKNLYDLLINQYLIIKDENDEVRDIRVWRNDHHEELKLPKIKGLKHKNALQACALDLLNNDDIPIKFLCGTVGSGKTKLAMSISLHKILEQGTYQKLLMIRSPYIDKDAQLGFLPGDEREKMAKFLRSMEQYINGGERALITLEQREIIDFDVPNTEMKGLTIEDTLIVVDESEDFTIRQIKMVGSRVGKGSSVIFTGDWEQAEGKFTRNNALRNACNTLKEDPLVGIVVLEKDERSSASRVFIRL